MSLLKCWATLIRAIQLDVDSLATQIATWRELGMVNPGVDAKAIVDLSFIKPASSKPR